MDRVKSNTYCKIIILLTVNRTNHFVRPRHSQEKFEDSWVSCRQLSHLLVSGECTIIHTCKVLQEYSPYQTIEDDSLRDSYVVNKIPLREITTVYNTSRVPEGRLFPDYESPMSTIVHGCPPIDDCTCLGSGTLSVGTLTSIRWVRKSNGPLPCHFQNLSMKTP